MSFLSEIFSVKLPASRPANRPGSALRDSAPLPKEANRKDDNDYYGDDLDPICQCHIGSPKRPIMTWSVRDRALDRRDKIPVKPE